MNVVLLSVGILIVSAAQAATTSPYLNNRIRYVARVLYDGTSFNGWQDQGDLAGRRTVQGTINTKLSRRFDRKITAVGAGRTDRGVHASGQVIHFDMTEPLEDIPLFEYAFNRMLPTDIRLYNTTKAARVIDRSIVVDEAVPGNAEQVSVSEIFHATKSAVGKLYVYRFCTNAIIVPTKRLYYGHVYYPIDMTLFTECLQLFVGTHDFKAFGNNVEKTLRDFEAKAEGIDFNTIRTVNSIQLIDEGSGYWNIEFNINSAIYKMIRNIVGTSLHVAAGRMSIDKLHSLLIEAPFRHENKAKSAQPQGLTLEHVFYDHY